MRSEVSLLPVLKRVLPPFFSNKSIKNNVKRNAAAHPKDYVYRKFGSKINQYVLIIMLSIERIYVFCAILPSFSIQVFWEETEQKLTWRYISAPRMILIKLSHIKFIKHSSTHTHNSNKEQIHQLPSSLLPPYRHPHATCDLEESTDGFWRLILCVYLASEIGLNNRPVFVSNLLPV